MNTDKGLNYYMNLDYDIILRKKDHFFLGIPELSLFVKGDTLDEAYKRLYAEKEIVFQRYIDADMQNDITEPKKKKPKNSLQGVFSDMVPFFLKISTIAVVILISTVLIANLALLSLKDISYRLEDLVFKNINQIALHSINLVRDTNHRLNTLTPEEKEAYILLLRNKVQQIKPFYDEVAVLWKDTGILENKNPSKNKKSN
jgi:hypothetical protein